MDDSSTYEELLNFFKALADDSRLKIVGLLAQRSYTVEQLAALLGLGMSTTSHHLSRLAQTGLVSARPDGHYYYYSLQTDVLHNISQRLLRSDTYSSLSQEVDLAAYDRKVLKSFTDENGRIIVFPSQEKKLLAILRHVVKAFEPDRRYSEKQVNEILANYNEDTAFLRRNLVSYRFMDREGGGGDYWRLAQDSAAVPSARKVR